MYYSKQVIGIFLKWMLIALALCLFIYMNSKKFSIESIDALAPWFFGLSALIGMIRIVAGILLARLKRKKESKIKIDIPSYDKKVFTF